MSIDTPSTVIIAGWYPDPTDGSQARWWDGGQWTSNLRPRATAAAAPAAAPLQAPVAAPAATPAPVPVSAPELAPVQSVAAPAPVDDPAPVPPSTPATIAAPAPAPTQASAIAGEQQARYFSPVPVRTDATLPPIDPYRPMNRRHDSQGFVSMGVKQVVKFNPTRAYTGSVWAIATMPIWTTLITLALIFGLGDFYTTFLITVTGVVFFVIAVAFAIHDQKVMLNSLHPTAASPWWMLLSPLIYLIVRGVHVSRTVGHGWAPLIIFVICSFVPAAAVLAFSALFVFFSSLIS